MSALAVTAGLLAVGTVAASAPSPAAAASRCPEGTTPPVVAGAPPACIHADAPPPGVDVRVKPTVAELRQRDGAADAAVAAAQDSGVPTPAGYASGATVPCDGDGTSGYRTQAMYVVAADAPNRYAAVAASIQTWAAGVDDVVNRSAALTGGVRHVRYVTSDNGDGTCSPTVLNVTVPAGANASFSSTINAVRALGYTSPARKYLMWVDATGYCGIAQTYPYSNADQGNPNNGSYPQFARVDAACWGQALSVEAHEFTHTLGSVMADAPHHTTNGHCWDESDRMCYADGSGIAMQQVCPAVHEALLDCNADDYFSTYPAAGSYLATHWNTANSRFLIGGGDGASGGQPGTPTTLGVGIAVNNPAIPGLPTQVSATPQVPAGRTATVRWTSARPDCTFADPTAAQTTVTCSAGSATTTSVTVTATDSTAVTAKASSALTFTTSPRALATSFTVDTTTDSARYDGCTGGRAPLAATVTDAATGLPVKGLPTAFYAGSGTTTRTLAKVASSYLGVASPAGYLTVVNGVSLSAKAGGVTAWPLTSSVTTTEYATAPCAAQLSMSPSATLTGYGDKVTFSGRLTKTVAGQTLGAAGERVTVYETVPGATSRVVLGAAATGASGSYSVALPMKASGVVVAERAASAAYTAAQSPTTGVTVFPYSTASTVAVDRGDVAYQQPVVVSGTLNRTGNGVTSPAAGLRVAVRYTGASGRVTSATALVGADGRYSVTLRPAESGNVTAAFTAVPGYSASSAGPVAVNVGAYTTALVLSSAAPTSVASGGRVTVTGSATRTYNGATAPAVGVRVTLTFTPSGGSPVVSYAVVDTFGNWRGYVYPKAGGVLTARVANVAGYSAATATAAPAITVA